MPLPPEMLAADAAFVFRDSGGVELSLGAASTWGHIDIANAGEPGPRARTSTAVYRLTFHRGTLPGTRAGAEVWSGGERYRLVKPLTEEFTAGLNEEWEAVKQ